MFFVPVLFWLSSVFQDFLVYLFPLCFWFLVYENPNKTERPFGVIHVCLVGANVILKLLFGSFSRCSTTFCLAFRWSCVFVFLQFSRFPLSKKPSLLHSPGNRSYPRWLSFRRFRGVGSVKDWNYHRFAEKMCLNRMGSFTLDKIMYSVESIIER